MQSRRFVAVFLITAAACGSKKEQDAPQLERDAAVAVIADAAIEAPPVPVRTEHPVFHLVDNRHAAHRFVDDELVVDASDIGFARYIRFGVPAPRWHLGQLVEGQRAAIADKLAVLELPLTVRQSQTAVQLTLRIHGEAKQAVSLKINGRKGGKDATVALVAGWQTVTIPVESGRFIVGENQLVLETSGGRAKIAVAWLRLGALHTVHTPHTPHTGATPPDDPRAHTTFNPKTGAIELRKGAALSWFVTIPDGAHLVADVSEGCRIEVRARASDDSFAGGLLAGSRSRVDLTAMAGQVVALSLASVDCPVATITAPRITLHGPAPTALPKAEPPRYIILWVMDALRADKLPAFTPGARAQTPNFDELAKTSAVFRQFYVQGNESQTSHASMWSSLYPAVHGVRTAGANGKWRLDANVELIAQKLGEAGLFTSAVTGNGYVNADGGYARGFKEFRNMMRESGVDHGVIHGQKIVDAALGQLDKHRAEPTYLFMGTIDTHAPWIARKPWINIYSPGPYHGPFQDFATAKDLGFKPGSMGCGIIPPKQDIERLRAIYDSAVSYHDHQLGRLVAQLKSWGIWGQTMLVITADHGEELFEDIRCGHGGSLRDSLVRVPLVIHDPARFPGGTIIEEGAEAVDIMPTMLDAVGAPPVVAAQGHALEPLAQGLGKGWPNPSYASMYEYAHAMRIGRWKARVGKNGTPIIGDLVGDPGETQDLSATKAIERRMLTDNLGMFLALRTQWKKRAWGVVSNVTSVGAAALDEATTP